MKSRILTLAILVGILAVTVGAQKPADQQKKSPEFFVRIAADVARNVQPDVVNGSLGIYIDEQTWAAGLKDSDLGPFLKIKEARAGRTAAFLFSPAKDAALCVYFDGGSPFGVAGLKAGASGKLEPADIAAAYKAVTKEMLKKGAEELTFASVDGINTDDGQALPAFTIGPAGK